MIIETQHFAISKYLLSIYIYFDKKLETEKFTSNSFLIGGRILKDDDSEGGEADLLFIGEFSPELI